MPANILPVLTSGVFPASLCTAFAEDREYAMLRNSYNDGAIQQSQLAQSSRRTFVLAKRLSAAALATLYAFWVAHNGGLIAFVFYNPFEPASGQPIGSNYDATGASTQGRYTVRFSGAGWAQGTDVCRTAVQGITLTEVA